MASYVCRPGSGGASVAYGDGPQHPAVHRVLLDLYLKVSMSAGSTRRSAGDGHAPRCTHTKSFSLFFRGKKRPATSAVRRRPSLGVRGSGPTPYATCRRGRRRGGARLVWTGPRLLARGFRGRDRRETPRSPTAHGRPGGTPRGPRAGNPSSRCRARGGSWPRLGRIDVDAAVADSNRQRALPRCLFQQDHDRRRTGFLEYRPGGPRRDAGHWQAAVAGHRDRP